MCKKKICTAAIAVTMKGTIKWKVKKRVKVALFTANPPQSQRTKSGPKYGKAEKRLVITVAPQNLICPHGRTYPRKAAAITRISRKTPVIHVFTYM